ncbi:ABC transporter permease [Lachnoclostridium phytofermentans]|uniref:ABC3 transporter permease C-terminal domain-containing protein n=1 Tax=Lachnoclostridium phytofermentans (strain ATCC 700394 / DSM 18823 / ISDg) TaxID=357809 RepID=A9KPR9_LACP7|nr:FtsX-like permease family protein [Lachnoclostridium phytofermentans]ABX41818.1 protein of unknown function DUF214 [Lachnoclostridium phytofermentans ISDg]
MIGRMLKKDLLRKRVITVTLFVFIMLAALLVAGAAGIITELFGSMDSLFEKSSVPHFMQMHAGEIDQPAIDSFVEERVDIVKNQQTVELLNINGANIILGNNENSEADSVMENAFVKQNVTFDFLQDTDNQILQMQDGEIVVPLYHKQQYNLHIGDTVRVTSGSFSMKFTIAAFVRDAQMNPSIITSKRFLVSDNDWNSLEEALGEIKYLIEFQLYDINRVGELESLYQSSGLPQKGTVVTYSLYRLMNSLADGIVAAVIILVGILLVAIAALCLRFTMLTAIEEDYREIGVMKAIGLNHKYIRKLYLTKYVAMAATAGICGYVLSRLISYVFTANITLYMGSAEKNIWSVMFPVAGAGLVIIAVAAFCRLVLRRFKHISAVEAIRTGSSRGGGRMRWGFKLHESKLPNVNVFLGVKEVLGHFQSYGLLCFVFVICSFLMIVPLNALNTIESPKFITYMGAGQCDIRIDLQQAGDMERRYNDMMGYIQNDNDIEKYSALITSTFQALSREGLYENIKVEIGDFTKFPLEYSSGSAPRLENDIALSVMNASEFQKSVGDTLTVLVNGEKRNLTVCGIYQDVTNGGKTAKAILPYDPDNILWYIANLDVKDGTDVPAKIKEYAAAFYPAKVTDMNDYMSQTLRGIVSQLELVVRFSLGLSIGIAVLITAMFIKMLTAKDSAPISIMRGLGFSLRHIRTQYITRVLFVLFIGILIGTLAAGTLGQRIVSVIIPGVTSLKFVINPLVAYILCPLLLAAAVTATIWISGISMKKMSDLRIVAE